MVCDVFANVAIKLAADELVDFRDQDSHLRDELDETLRHEDDTIVLSQLSALDDDVSDLGGDLGQGLVLGFNFLTDEETINAGSKRALESDMRS